MVSWPPKDNIVTCKKITSSKIDSYADFGCGTGIMLEKMGQEFSITKTVGYDYSEIARAYCTQKTRHAVYPLNLNVDNHFQNQFDFITALDVIEHIESESAAINNISSALIPGGFTLITVPAYQFMWSITMT